MGSPKRIGMLTPSSNTVLEPYTSAILAGLSPDVTCHFGRFRVTEISLSDGALGQFDNEPMLVAAELLADARMDVIAWNGTSAAWRGFHTDEELCAEITRRTGIQASSTILALNEILRRSNVRRLGLVSPYLDDVQQRIMANYAEAGIEVTAEEHLGESVNYAFAEVSESDIARMIGKVAAARPDAITVLCTNMRGARIAAEMEKEIGIPILDSVSVTVWKTLCLTGTSPARVKGWGRFFQELI
ncbi:aspartate/glutamate racemase family protein [Telmatospirillum sp. J64-1]|uniref:maleate cis-trans isomerase family protein n=1 Tax=Telmatospirillum sp. J64-1 TaxID=2502183 RepID=UPI001C8F2754|nr:aspartate/glutamate racemase family protein [Telmatospirillum sp. J64-1]